jgi:hypothetical protein
MDALTGATITIMISGCIYPRSSAPINISITIWGDGINGAEGAPTLTTSGSGEFSMSFTPTSIGLYTITASFPGNERYAASSAGISVNVKVNYFTLVVLIIALVMVGTIAFLARYLLGKKGMMTHSV